MTSYPRIWIRSCAIDEIPHAFLYKYPISYEKEEGDATGEKMKNIHHVPPLAG